MRGYAVAAAAAVLALASPDAEPGRRILDAFDGISGWTAAPSDGVSMSLAPDRGESGGALRVDFDFRGRAGWAASRKRFPAALPENWSFAVRLRGEASPQTLEFKLLDASGENVWWSVKRNLALPREWTTLRYPKRRVEFAWGPGDRNAPLRQLGFVEITVTAASGGKGTLWIDRLELEALPPEGAPLPPTRSWTGDAAKGERQDLVVDLGGRRELGGLSLEWDTRDFPRRYEVALSQDGTTWETRRTVATGRGGRAWIALHDAEAAFVRLRTLVGNRGGRYRLAEIRVEPPSFSDTPTKFLEAVARASPRGQWPRQLVGEQVYWSIVGVSGGRDKALLSEDGILEVGRGAFTLEPFLIADGRVLGWDAAQTTHALVDGEIPLPSVKRSYADGLSLEVAAFAEGAPDSSIARVRYRVGNTGEPRRVTLAVCFRPMQVNPPWQWLNVPGGFAPLTSISGSADRADANSTRAVWALTTADSFGATRFDQGEIVSRLAAKDFPPAAPAEDADGLASAAFVWSLDPAAARDAVLMVPLSGPVAVPATADPASEFAAGLEAAARGWRDALGGVTFTLPPEAREIARAARTNLGWILMQRDGPAIQPGSRAYARSWIRDGSLTSTALLRMGRPEAARDFLKWFAPYELSDGAVPCCVDRRGADPVPEHDSHGELCYLANTYFRYTGDRSTAETVWPRVARAAAHIDALRRSRRTDEYRSGPKRAFFGLLPESISHEGYSDKPVHSYWDDFWGLRGLSDAAELAAALGHAEYAARIRGWRDEMREDVHASIRRVIAERKLDFIPGSADLGDFDATSTTIALDPCAEASRLPREQLEGTFERYWRDFVARRRDPATSRAYTPYEWRVAGSMVRLGRRDRVKALFDFFMSDRRPSEWNHWAEVVFPGVRDPKSMGDMPHGWVGSDFIRAFLDLFAYERVEDEALVLGAGLPPEWLVTESGAGVSGLRTPWGTLDLWMRADARRLRAKIGGAIRVPPGGFAIPWPLAGRAASARINGRTVFATERGEIVVREVPAEIEAPAP
ncbi:MAG TPA: discoidin domain-containing protein [Thermoanaerobaculia bacterium]|nr:discoidin domain-containing protein [Thermoanaerobaculia bacterium]